MHPEEELIEDCFPALFEEPDPVKADASSAESAATTNLVDSLAEPIEPRSSRVRANLVDVSVERIEPRKYQVKVENIRTGKTLIVFRGSCERCHDFKDELEDLLDG